MLVREYGHIAECEKSLLKLNVTIDMFDWRIKFRKILYSMRKLKQISYKQNMSE